MGLQSDVKSHLPIDPSRHNSQLNEFFKGELERLRLTDEQIEQQSVPELESSLETVNDALKNPDSFGVLRIKITADTGFLITTANQNFHYEVGILPLLLRAKRHVIERGASLKSAQEVKNLAELIAKVVDQGTKDKLQQELKRLEEVSSALQERYEEFQEQQTKELNRVQAESVTRLGQLKFTKTVLTGYRLASGMLLLLIGMWAILDGPNHAPWLAGHPKILPLKITAAIAVVGLAWIAMDTNVTRRWFALSSIVVAAIFGIIQLL
ncbi:MAG TPA: hypothetical protein VN844_14155 [Pyrinomonadaceae bacterium]|nr:hypothetical protein [Pyrinomonadaceae bacterium]